MKANYKVALVTGASAGFGLAICKRLVKDGLKVIAVARREDKLEALHKELGDNLLPVALDVSDVKAVESLKERLPEGFKEVDVLINNAGLAVGLNKVQDSCVSEMQTMINTNVTGLVAMTHAFLKDMVERNRGFIINLGSTAGDWPYVGGNVYGATKAFVAQFTRNLRTDLIGTAVKATVIKPGLCSDTEFSNVRFKGDSAKVEATYKDTESILPEDIADTVSYLVALPAHVNVNEIEMMPVCQSYGGLCVTRNLKLN